MKNKLDIQRINNSTLKSKFKFLFGFNPLEQKASFKHTLINKDES